MWNMIAKDLYLQRLRMTLLVVLTGAAVGGMFLGNSDMRRGGLYAAVMVLVLAITYTFTLYSCFHEDKNKSLSFLRSLPVPARTVVNSKFAAMIILEAVVLILLFVLLYLGRMTGMPMTGGLFTDLSFFVLVGLIVLLFNSIVLLIYFRWGYVRIQWVYTISFFVIFFGSMQLERIVPKVIIFFPGISPGQVTVLGAALVLLAVFFCWKGSVSALSKKDLT